MKAKLAAACITLSVAVTSCRKPQESVGAKLCRLINEAIVKQGGQSRFEQTITAEIKNDPRNCQYQLREIPGLKPCGEINAAIIAFRKAGCK